MEDASARGFLPCGNIEGTGGKRKKKREKREKERVRKRERVHRLISNLPDRREWKRQEEEEEEEF